MKSIVSSLFLIILGFASFKEGEGGKYRIKLPEYDLVFVPNNCNGLISRVDKKNNRYFKLHLKNCQGNMLLECFNLKDSTLKEKGSYIASLDLLGSYVNAINGTTGENEIKVSRYYQPLRDGIWYFYDSNKVVKTIRYKRGVLQETR